MIWALLTVFLSFTTPLPRPKIPAPRRHMVMCTSNILKSILNGLILARERGKILEAMPFS
jgi:hypothetical protein